MRIRMRIAPARRAASIAAVLAAGLALVGCGQGSTPGTPTLRSVPFASGARVVDRQRRCDRGAHAYCSLQLVVVGPGYPDSHALQRAQSRLLRADGWSAAQGQTTKEQADDSGSNGLRVTYATAANDLQSIDLGTIKRAGPIARGLSARMFARTPTLSVLVQTGAG